MNSDVETSWVELSAEDSAAAIRAHSLHSYRMAELKGEDAYIPEVQENGCLVVDKIGASALDACLRENITYTLDLLYGKWVKEGGIYRFKNGFIENNLRNQQQIPPPEQLERLVSFADTMKRRLRDSQRVHIVLTDFIFGQEAEEAAA